MQETSGFVDFNLDLPPGTKIAVQWKKGIQIKSKLKAGSLLGTYIVLGKDQTNSQRIELKTPISGTLIFMEQGEQEISSHRICVFAKCKHDVIIAGMCTFCAERVLQHENESVGFAHKNFLLSFERAQELYQNMETKALQQKKLFLILDLDNTLIHTERILSRVDGTEPLKFDPDIQKQEGISVIDFSGEKFIVKFRPFLQEFLKNMNTKYQIHIYTKGTRDYAETILKMIDPSESFISLDRLISRNEMGKDEFKSIKKVIHDGKMALILDDRSDVWGNVRNLVYTQPYNVFRISKGQIRIRIKNDVFLYMIQGALEFIHQIFYSFYSRHHRIEVHRIYEILKTNLLADQHIVIQNLSLRDKNPKDSEEYRVLKELGANEIVFEPTNSTTLTFDALKGKDENLFSQVPVVSFWYSYYCQLYCLPLDPIHFDLRNPHEILKRLEESRQFEKSKRKQVQSEMEEYLQERTLDTKGFSSIETTIIQKIYAQISNRKISKDNPDNSHSFENTQKKIKTL